MAQTRFELKEDGKFISLDTLREYAQEEIRGELDIMPMEDAICLGNKIRDDNGYDHLYENNSDGLDSALEDEDPSTIIKLEWDPYADYFIWDGDDLTTTNDVWYDLDADDIADAILDGEYSDYTTSDMDDIVADYKEAKEFLERRKRFPAERTEGEELLVKYANGEAEATDLLQYITRLVKKDEVWRVN